MGGNDDYRFLSLISYKSVKGRTEDMKSFEFPYGKGSQSLALDERYIQYYLQVLPRTLYPMKKRLSAILFAIPSAAVLFSIV